MWNLVSRLTGFLRVLAIGAALGATFLGNTYQSANLVSNVLFELLAAGVLSSVLIPSFVRHVADDDRSAATRLGDAVLGILIAALGTVVLVGLLSASWIMRLLTVAVESPAVRQQQMELGVFFLWFFLPQILLYAIATVATGLLHADNRFSAPAIAPVLNNLIVITTMMLFWAMRSDAPTLNLGLNQKLILAVGTTLGVAAMAMVSLIAAWRSGFCLCPRWQPKHAELRTMAKKGLWAAGYLGLTQVLLGVTLVLANRLEGGVVAYQIAFTFFLFPFALLGNPILTTLFPQLSGDIHRNDQMAFGQHLGSGIRQLSFFILPTSIFLAVLSQPILNAVSLGALSAQSELVARTLVGYAVGLFGYSTFQLLTRASYAAEDTRSPTLINLAMTITGSALMFWWTSSTDGINQVAALGAAHSVVQLAGAIVLMMVIAKKLPHSLDVVVPIVRSCGSSAVAGLAVWYLVEIIPLEGRFGAAFTVAMAGFVGVAIYAGIQFALGSPEVRRQEPQEASV